MSVTERKDLTGKKATISSLPLDGEQTGITLSDRSKVSNPKYYVGCSIWGAKEWIGTVYPPETKQKKWFSEYVQRFKTIELHPTFYLIPNPEILQEWITIADQDAMEGFLICPKISRQISHVSKLRNVESDMDAFLMAVRAFKVHLGPILLQLGEKFKTKHYQKLEDFIKSLPHDLRFFIEVKHESWFQDKTVRKQLFKLLAEQNVGAVINDDTTKRHAIHMELAIPELFVRFSSGGKDVLQSDKARIDEWIDRLEDWVNHGLEKVFFIISMQEGELPILAEYAIEQLNLHLGSTLKNITLQQ
jgi:uncharacterized protein YecE (DUF72 family)